VNSVKTGHAEVGLVYLLYVLQVNLFTILVCLIGNNLLNKLFILISIIPFSDIGLKFT